MNILLSERRLNNVMIDALNNLIGRSAIIGTESGSLFYDVEYWCCTLIICVFIYCFFRFLSYLFGGKS